MSWHQLPTELQWAVLDALAEDKHCSLANAAAVSRDWQHRLEPHTFAQIRLTSSRIPKLNSMTVRNRSLIRSLWLCIELPLSSCLSFGDSGGEAFELAWLGNDTISRTLGSAFHALGTWDPTSSLTLDISVFSDSEGELSPGHMGLIPDAPGRLPSRHKDKRRVLGRSDQYYDEYRWAPYYLRPLLMSKDYDESDLNPHPGATNSWWPQISAVTRLVMRLQNRRQWEPLTVRRILSHLPRLREFHYEPWRHQIDQRQGWQDFEFDHISTAATGLKRVSIFENSSQRILPRYLLQSPPMRPRNRALGFMLARDYCDVEALSVSFMVEASHFLDTSSPRSWPNLTCLVLTSRLLAPGTSPAEVMQLLRAAATAARLMPKLQTLEIWNGMESIAALFKFEYHDSRQPSVITWRGTWTLTLDADVIDAWDVVSRRRGCERRLHVVYESLDAEDIISHADAIIKLELPELVIRPVSVQQIREQERFYRALDFPAAT